ncbi:MAG TPA: MdtA/MuxA family multidrug efflux RND transporter periplasmic adaptor subunit [Opitutaceae bacterium]|nr:MdtA/MuxA family multidrug efflux RND transporter periplasmic adaptor subunit [Opitutaceae bacterium]
MSLITTPQIPRPPVKTQKPRRSRVWLWIVLIAAAGLGVFFYLHSKNSEADQAGQAGPGGRGGRGGPGRGAFFNQPTVVSTAQAKIGSLPDYINALGTVTALNTATVHSRVDGQLNKVNFEEGQNVKAGDVLAEIDSRPFESELAQAQGQLARDEAFLVNAQADLQRYQEAREAVTQQQLDAAKAAVAQYEGSIKADKAMVATAQLNVSFCKVTAPIDGRVGLRQVDVGNLVRSSDANGIVVITQIQPISVRFSIPEDRLPSVNRARAAGEKLTVDIFDRAMRRKLATGEVVALDNQIDTTTGTLRVKAIVPNDDLSLFPNQFVNVQLLVRIEENIVLVPTTAVQIIGTERYVYVVLPDNTVERRQVKIGNSLTDFTAIREGVKEGETLVTEGIDRLQTGSQVMTRDQAVQRATAIQSNPQNAMPPGPANGRRNGERGKRWKNKDGSAPAKKSQ